MIYPKSLKVGDTIKIISPSNGVKAKKIEVLNQAEKFLQDYGFHVIEDPYVRNSNKGVSSTARNRALELNKAICDKDVQALIACSGGDYLIQILDLISYKNILNNLKWIQGQSDITPLLFYITTNYDIATIYSFNAKTFGNYNIPKRMLDNDIKIWMGDIPTQIEYDVKIDEEKKLQPWECMTDFKPIEGRIIGGCLDSLKDIIGTKYDKTKKFINKYQEDGIVWYFDIAEMTNEDILRTMWQLKKLGWFQKCNGILFGRIENEITYTNTTLKEAIKYNLEDLKIPILINVDIGHTDPVFTIVNGSIVKIDKKGKYRMEMLLK